MEILAQNFPGAFSGYKLEVTESHQRQKADTSGTAKAIVSSFGKLGTPIQEVTGFSASSDPPLCGCALLLDQPLH